MSLVAHYGIDRLNEISNFVSIEGNIGSGKTTFKRAIEHYVNENHLSALESWPIPRPDVYLLVDEPVAEWTQEVYSLQNVHGKGANGDSKYYSLLDLFYKEMNDSHTDTTMLDRVAFTFQVNAFTSRIKHLRNILSQMPRHPPETRVHLISERSLLTDRLFFTNLNNAGFIPGYQWKTYNDFFDIICETLVKKHDRIVYLPTSPNKSYDRIMSRDRGAEVKNSISLGYLESLHLSHITMIEAFEQEKGTQSVLRVNFEQDLVPPQIEDLVKLFMKEILL